MNIGKGEQFEPEFLRISPNNRIPAIVDDAPADGGAPISVFESGAILHYLAEKTGRFLPGDVRGRTEVMQWLFWQMAGLGPMAGQNHHFVQYAPEHIPYAIERYVKETTRLYGVLDRRLADREFVAGEYSIADMACYPWIVPHERQRPGPRRLPAPATLVRVDCRRDRPWSAPMRWRKRSKPRRRCRRRPRKCSSVRPPGRE